MELENKETEVTETEKKDCLVTEAEENELTSGYLKKTTNIGNCTWLSLFLIQLVGGGIASMVYPILIFKQESYSDSYILAMTDISAGILLLLLAIFAFRAFVNRQKNAVFLATSYLVLCIVANLLVVMTGYYSDNNAARVMLALV